MADIEYEGILHRIDVDFGCERATPITRVKQGDKNGRKLVIRPRENGEGIVLTNENGVKYCDPEDIQCELRVQRPDGAVYTTNTPYARAGYATGKGQEIILDYIAFTLDEDMLAVSGRAYCDVYLWVYNNGYEASTAGFYVDIDPKPTATSSGGLSPTSPINIEAVSADEWGTFTPSPETLYIVTSDSGANMYFGGSEIIGGRSPILQTANITNKAQSIVREVEQ